jgi:hypothetical protein
MEFRGARTSSQEGRRPGIPAYIRVVRCLSTIFEQRDEEALDLARATLADPGADAMCRCWALVQIGMVSFLRQDWEECRRVSLDGIEMCRAVGETWTRELHLRALAVATWQLGDPRAAAPVLLEALNIDRRLDDLWHLAWSTETLSWITVDLGRDERAARLRIAAGYRRPPVPGWPARGAGIDAARPSPRRMAGPACPRSRPAHSSTTLVRSPSSPGGADAPSWPSLPRVGPRELRLPRSSLRLTNRESAAVPLAATVETHPAPHGQARRSRRDRSVARAGAPASLCVGQPFELAKGTAWGPTRRRTIAAAQEQPDRREQHDR